MQYIKQLLIILGISFAGEALRALLPLPVPASIYGMLLMLAVLVTGVVKLEQVKHAGKFLVAIMTLLFVPSSVGLMVQWDNLRPMLIPFIAITLISLVTTFAAAGWTTQLLMRRKSAKKATPEEVSP